METLTISSFPYYSFPPEIKQAIYVKGSAFYGLYFIVSFPTFYKLDEKLIEEKGPHSLTRTVLEAFGASMIVLCLLDFCRLYLDMPLTIQGSLFEVTNSAIRR
jgi:cycloeucalenol cycloisomerase